MHVVAVARPGEHNLARRILDMFKDEGIIERTWPYQVGLEKGIEKGRVEGIEKGIEKGVERGAESLRGALLGILAARGLRVTPVQRKRIADMHALDTLVTWVERAATAKTTGAIFVDNAATKPTRTRRA